MDKMPDLVVQTQSSSNHRLLSAGEWIRCTGLAFGLNPGLIEVNKLILPELLGALALIPKG